jgi:carboxymethylenebutenolidase
MVRRFTFAALAAGTVVIALGLAQAAQGQAWVTERLAKSPRHHEYVDVEAGAAGKVRSFVVYPEAAKKAPVAVVIHENKGLTDWVRSFADRLAEAGYIAVAPDLLSGFDEQHADTVAFGGEDAARAAIYKLDSQKVSDRLVAVTGYAKGLPAGNGKVASVGFCWGGGQSFRLATTSPDLAQAVVFYGTAPDDPASFKSVKAPVDGFYGGRDERVNATLAATAKAMTDAGKNFESEIYDGAGHGFMRVGEDPAAAEADRKARDAAWARLTKILEALR